MVYSTVESSCQQFSPVRAFRLHTIFLPFQPIFLLDILKCLFHSPPKRIMTKEISTFRKLILLPDSGTAVTVGQSPGSVKANPRLSCGISYSFRPHIILTFTINLSSKDKRTLSRSSVPHLIISPWMAPSILPFSYSAHI